MFGWYVLGVQIWCRFVPVIHFRKQAVTDGTKPDLNIGSQGLAAWFRAKSTTQLNILILKRWRQVHRRKENLSNASFKWWKVLCFSSWHPPSQHHLRRTSIYLFPLKFKSIPVQKIWVFSPRMTIFWLVGNLNHIQNWDYYLNSLLEVD